MMLVFLLIRRASFFLLNAITLRIYFKRQYVLLRNKHIENLRENGFLLKDALDRTDEVVFS